VDAVLEASNIIEGTTLMRDQIKGDEARHKQDMIDWYLGEDWQKMAYRMPSKADTFERLRDKKSSKAKDYAIEIVTKMYRLDCIDRKELGKEKGERDKSGW
jgi:hypothetical protein